MAQRGPKPKPTALRVLEGDPKKNRYNMDEPVYGDFDVADVPDSVSRNPDALRLWNLIGTRLAEVGILKDLHAPALEVLCVQYGMWSMRPQVAMSKTMMAFFAEFGMTPSSQTRLVGKLPHETDTTSAASILAARRAAN